MADEAEQVGQEGVERRRRTLLAWLALGVVLAAVVALLVIDLWVVQPPARRAFVARNLECLRCHTDMIPRRAAASVHEPFLMLHCTSCHTRHGYSVTSVALPRSTGPRWLQQFLEQIGLRAVWGLLTTLRVVRPAEVQPATSSRVTGGPSHLIAGEKTLCWTCHGNLAPERLEQFQHKPFADCTCTSCHDPHSSKDAPLLRASTATLCAACHRVGPELLRTDVHPPFAKLQCVSCHAPHASANAGLLVASQRDLCFRCHPGTAALLGDPAQHEPFESGQCTRCHRPHSGDFSRLLAAPQPELCYRCHGNVAGEFARASRHPVPSRLLCSDCHLPHAAPVRGLLPVAQRQLCLGCHGSMRAELTKAVVHDPVGRGDCTQCHLPHGAPVASLLPVSDPALCQRCHAVTSLPARSPAPFRSERRTPSITLGPGKQPGTQRPVGTPDPTVRAGPRYARSRGDTSHRCSRCEDCHRAHSSDYSQLTVARGDALCLGCHARDVPRFAASRHGKLSCTRCHAPHNAAPYLLRGGGNPQVCLGCHRGFGMTDKVHPADGRYYDYLARGPMTCTSTCHDPHGSRNVRMLRLPYNSEGYGSDYLCLACHTKVGLVY